MVGGAIGFESPVNVLLETRTGYLAAWVSVGSDQATVWLARLDPSGALVGSPAPLRAPASAIDEVEPSLVPFGDAVAVLWARGTHIFICGGCVPDHRIDLVLIDPGDFTPVSDVVSLTNGAAPGPNNRAGGLLRRQVAKVGQSLLTTVDVTFHVHHTSASAAFSCQP
jgi:hypothetical protein